MSTRSVSSFAVALFVLLVSVIETPALAQSAPRPEQSDDWRTANDTVGKFQRGHSDVLKWESGNQPAVPDVPTHGGELVLKSSGDAAREAWKIHLDLAKTRAILGSENERFVAEGRWGDVDPDWLRRAEGLDELIDVSAAARKAWLDAVAAQQALRYRKEALVAAESAAELATRMARVGNWSKLQETRLHIALNAARMDVERAGYTLALAQAELLGVLGLSGVHTSVALPDALPELPKMASTTQAIQQRLDVLSIKLPRADNLRVRANAQVSAAAYRAAYDLARLATENLKWQETVVEETLLKYNGMLASVWDLLGEARERSQAALDSVEALRDFWMAEADLQYVLIGGVPERFVSLGNSGAGNQATSSH
ncbi:TolC family protein [Propionivibrio soli]|uniref:TolC family protein n=1 Tax=Propionivibrio soli TaxID=2976531 RepID=UPI0021E7C6CA